MRIINLSVDGIKQAADRGLFDWLNQQDADMICLQDLRCSEYDLSDNLFFPHGYFPYFCDTADGSNGVMIYTKDLPRAIMMGLGFNPELDLEGRYLQADFEHISIISLLTPHSDNTPKSADHKQRFFEHLQQHLEKISHKRREFIICGNFNIAHTSTDLQHSENYQQHSGFLSRERLWMEQLFNEMNYIDCFRTLHPDSPAFSWQPESGGDQWRTDYQVASFSLGNHISNAYFYTDQKFSSHFPLIIDYDFDL